MIEQVFKITSGNNKAVEKIVQDENVHYIHMIFNRNEGLPEHFSNSNVYMTVVRGNLSITLDDQDTHEYPAFSLLKIPMGIKMNVRNISEETLELIVVKAPAPK
ncbi:MAG: cupin domain-containing protein [Synergistaceae bacterium]|nr:cupin domain-containing protein [Synergistaceae bacterium]